MFIEALLNLLFNKTDIINYRVNDAGELYLRRWFIYPRKPDNLAMVPRLYLHKFYTGDNDRHLHDHPWPYTSLILWNGYHEISFNPTWLKWKARHDRWTPGSINKWERPDPEPPQTLTKWIGPGRIIKRGAAWAHSVKLNVTNKGRTRHAWSLVLTGIKERSWGFHTETGWCWWRKYDKGMCICEDGSPDEKFRK
jgi:hypothetical protein